MLSSDQIGAVCLCLSAQLQRVSRLQFDIPVVRDQYTINKSPFSPGDELAFVQRCARSSFLELKRVCTATPCDFESLSLSFHLMQTCCKRASMFFMDEKFECAAIVQYPTMLSFVDCMPLCVPMPITSCSDSLSAHKSMRRLTSNSSRMEGGGLSIS